MRRRIEQGCHPHLRGCRLAVAFTGLAEHGSFLTRRWLLEALSGVGPPDYLIGHMLARFRDRATRDIGRLKVADPRHKRLTVVLAGYHYREDPPRSYCFVVSNFEDADPEKPERDEPAAEFTTSYLRAKYPVGGKATLVVAAGATSGLGNTEGLAALVKDRRPADAVVGKAVGGPPNYYRGTLRFPPHASTTRPPSRERPTCPPTSGPVATSLSPSPSLKHGQRTRLANPLSSCPKFPATKPALAGAD